jgi:hypothetical protein
MSGKLIQVFESHTKLDEQTCNKFDIIAAREGMKVFRSEYEAIEPPAWNTIKYEMKRSVALFLLVGPELVKSQEEAAAKEWKFTQNWIAYEVGLACALGIDVWVLCDGVEINFPVPYLNNYSIGSFETNKYKFERSVLRAYMNGEKFPLSPWKFGTSCTYKDCGAKFNFYTYMVKDEMVPCPTCLRSIAFPEGWPLEKE